MSEQMKNQDPYGTDQNTIKHLMSALSRKVRDEDDDLDGVEQVEVEDES